MRRRGGDLPVTTPDTNGEGIPNSPIDNGTDTNVIGSTKRNNHKHRLKSPLLLLFSIKRLDARHLACSGFLVFVVFFSLQTSPVQIRQQLFQQYYTPSSTPLQLQIQEIKSTINHPVTKLLETTNADYGGINIGNAASNIKNDGQFKRVVSSTDAQSYEEFRLENFNVMDEEAEELSKKNRPSYDRIDGDWHTCYQVNWRNDVRLNCNTVHEQTLVRPYDDKFQPYNITYRGSGYYRDSWVMQSTWPLFHGSNNDDDDVWVWKRFRIKHSVLRKFIGQMQREALIMDIMTGTPRIVDVYGHCGLSILAEHMLEEVATPTMSKFTYDEYVDIEKIKSEQLAGVFPYNNLTNMEKLDMALVMAESMADIQGYRGGVIVHGDIHPVQWLKNHKGQIKLNDFNNAEILEWNPWDNKYCAVEHCYGGVYRSPEELGCRPCLEGMDTYSLGNNIYILLTGLWPFWDYTSSKGVQKKIGSEKTQLKPEIDPRYNDRSYIERELIKIMKLIWEFDPEKRITIFEVVQKLRALKLSVRSYSNK